MSLPRGQGYATFISLGEDLCFMKPRNCLRLCPQYLFGFTQAVTFLAVIYPIIIRACSIIEFNNKLSMLTIQNKYFKCNV